MIRGPVTSTQVPPVQQPPRWGLAIAAGVGIAVAAVLAAYSRVSPGDGGVISTFGFSALFAMKSWLTRRPWSSCVVQVVSALAMWGRLPGVSGRPGLGQPGAPLVRRHRLRPDAARGVPVHLVAGLLRRHRPDLIHSAAGLAFYGVFAAKMLSLRLRGLPGWTLPVLGGLLAALLTVVWFCSAFWYFTQPGVPLW